MKRAIAYSLPVLFVAFGVAAQTSTELRPLENIREGIYQGVQNVREIKQEVRESVKENTLEATQKIQTFRKEAVEQFQKQRKEAKGQIEQKREEVKSAIEARRAELKTTIEEKRQELKDRLRTVRDERKKQVAERLYTNLNTLNERITSQFLEKLNQVEDVLSRVKTRADKAEANGLDVSSARTAIEAATKAISDARTTIQNQAGKMYTISVTDETMLRKNVQTTRDQLHKDLAVVRDAVKATRDAVRTAAVALAQIPRVNEVEVEKSETNSTGATQ